MQTQADSVVFDTNGLLTSGFGPWRYEERYTILTMLTPPSSAAHLAVFNISVSRDPKIPTTSFNGPNISLNGRIPNSQLNGPISTDTFQTPQILRTISSGHDVIHTPASFPVWGFIMTMVIVISFACERKTVPNDYVPGLLTRIVQSPTKLNDKM